jgi:hypothetical protein
VDGRRRGEWEWELWWEACLLLLLLVILKIEGIVGSRERGASNRVRDRRGIEWVVGCSDRTAVIV